MRKYAKPTLLEGEEIRPLIFYFKEHPWYSISNYGRCWSHMKRVGKGKGNGYGTKIIYDPNHWDEKKWSKEYQKKQYSNGQKYTKVVSLYSKLTCPKGFFDGTLLDDDHEYFSSGDTTFTKRCTVHQCIMWTFRPIKEFPPDWLPAEDIANTPETVLQALAMSLCVNHKNHQPEHDNYVDPEDPSNDKLEYVLPSQNTKEAVAYYKGSTASAPELFLSGEYEARGNGETFVEISDSKPKSILNFVDDTT